LTIKIQVSVVNNQLSFLIENSFRESTDKSKNGGIGLVNIRKRLDLNYQNNYELKTEKRDNRYFAELTILNLNKSENAENNSKSDS